MARSGDRFAQCQAYCDHQGWEIAEIFSEPAASALEEGRPVFQEMIYKATRSERLFDLVVVHSLSRFSRDALHSELYFRQLAKAGFRLVSITQDMAQDASGEFIRKILNVFDEHPSRENAKHVHRAMCENARQGFWNGSRVPFGYRTEVRERRGTKDKKVIVIDGRVPAIVDEKTFKAAQALLQSRAPKRVPPRVVNGPTCLAGIARCGYCGAALIQNTGKGGAYRYHCCSRRLKEGIMGCRGMRIRMDRLDDIVIGEVTRRGAR